MSKTTATGALFALCAAITIALWYGALAGKPFNSEWLGFFGNVLGASVTAGAGYAAWTAVMRQIQSNEQTAARGEDAAYETSCEILQELTESYALIWRAVDIYLAANDSREYDRAAATTMGQLRRGLDRKLQIKELRSVSDKLDMKRRRKLQRVLQTIELTEGEINPPNFDDINDVDIDAQMMTVRVMLCHFSGELKKYAPAVQTALAAREHVEIDESPITEFLKPIVDTFEAELTKPIEEQVRR